MDLRDAKTAMAQLLAAFDHFNEERMGSAVANHLANLIPGTTDEDCSIAVAPLSHGAGSTPCSMWRVAPPPC